MRSYFFLTTLFIAVYLGAQPVAQLNGIVVDSDKSPLPGAVVIVENTSGTSQCLTDANGSYRLTNLATGNAKLRIQAVGFQHLQKAIALKAGKNVFSPTLEKDVLELDQVVVSATRSAVPIYEAPVIVAQLSDRTLDLTQSLSLAEGLSFSPGLRVENNCVNCGFTQLRINGLDGAYSQVLINSRPVFSALAGVYGLEMIPPNMIDRVEVVKGGGSALYGGSAIGGTINIITKDPVRNQVGAGINQSLIDGRVSDRSTHFNASVVNEAQSAGFNLYGFQRKRDPWDANGDGFSELTLLENTTFGLDAYWKPALRSTWRIHLNSINEFRRGGNKFDLEPHQTDITEQLQHRIRGGGLSYEWTSSDYAHRLSAYASAQHVDRSSYYGGGGRVLSPSDTLTEDDLIALNAYGQSEDISVVSGAQWIHDIRSNMTVTIGSEYQFNAVTDRMPGYDRQIDQRVGTWGSYAQLEYAPTERLSLLVGGRFDYVNIDGTYALGTENFINRRQLPVWVPRLNAKYQLTDAIALRASYAQGYRAPQAFDEDLHIETVGGAARFIRLDPELQTERSDSYTASVNFQRREKNRQLNMVLEAFHTRLSDPFILSDQQELPSGIAIITKRNGEGARVQGVNIELNYALGQRWIFQGGATWQSARYESPEVLWEGESENATPTVAENMLRTPDLYGFFTASWRAARHWSASLSGTYTGSMDVPHVIDPDTERTIIERSPAFFETNVKLSYNWTLQRAIDVELSAGVQNIFNAFQDDFDLGVTRDAGYIYGPLRPRTFFFALKVGLD